MCYHEWGDGFDFGLLNRAMHFIDIKYERYKNKYPIMKEKYGTIRYEFTSLWLHSDQDVIKFLDIIEKTIKKFPSIKDEIVEDLHYSVNWNKKELRKYFRIFYGEVKNDR